MQQGTDAPAPRPSSTVVLLREAAAAPEIFMVRRHEGTAFGSAHAFPGGVLEADDASVHAACEGLGADEANRLLGVEHGGLDYFSSAIRELFEESGVLLADIARIDHDLGPVRDSLNDGTLSWSDFVRSDEVVLRCGDLHYISHWITPATRPVRYSTRFFVAELPEGQSAAHCGRELTDSCWVTAEDMLAAAQRGEVEMHFPTVKTLESLARFDSKRALLDWAEACADWGVTTMQPAIIKRHGRSTVVLPGDVDYPGQSR